MYYQTHCSIVCIKMIHSNWLKLPHHDALRVILSEFGDLHPETQSFERRKKKGGGE